MAGRGLDLTLARRVDWYINGEGKGVKVTNNSVMPPIPRPGGVSQNHGPTKRSARRRRWPAWVTVVVSVVGIIIPIFAWNALVGQTRMLLAVVGFAGVLIVGTVMLFIQRVLDVGVARRSGTPLLSSFDLGDKFAFALLMVASVANGIIIALQVARQ